MIIHFIYRSYKIHIANFSVFQVFFIIVVITILIWVIEYDSKRDNWPPSSSSNEIWSPCSLLFMTLSPCSLSSAGVQEPKLTHRPGQTAPFIYWFPEMAVRGSLIFRIFRIGAGTFIVHLIVKLIFINFFNQSRIS